VTPAYEGDTPFWYAVFRGGGGKTVRSTQKFCYIVRRHRFLLLKGPIFSQKHNTRDIQSQITEFRH